jgi:hypothetical protein
MRHLLLRLRDEDMGRRHRFFQLDDRKHLRVRFTAWSSLPAEKIGRGHCAEPELKTL